KLEKCDKSNKNAGTQTNKHGCRPTKAYKQAHTRENLSNIHLHSKSFPRYFQSFIHRGHFFTLKKLYCLSSLLSSGYLIQERCSRGKEGQSWQMRPEQKTWRCFAGGNLRLFI